MPRIFLPYVELPCKRIPASLAEIRSVGFDGVECHLIGRLRSPQRIAELCREATDLNLDIHFHQGVSWATGQSGFYKVMLGAIGALVPVGTPLNQQIPKNVYAYPVVIYGNLVREPAQSNYRYQTASEHAGSAYAMPFQEFSMIVAERNLPVVFDIQHVLEWSQNVQGVDGLSMTPQTIGDMVMKLWLEFRSYVVEIHLCDFNPQLGRSCGRNVFLGNGVFPLAEFCAMVRDSGWDGAVVPEVAAQHLCGVHRLQMLWEKINSVLRIS